MAFTYGSVTKCKVGNNTTRNEYECRFGYEVQSQSIANNTSSVKLRLQVRSISSSYKTYGYNQTSTIDGTKLSAASFDMRDTNTWQTFGERTITVTHNSEGKYSASKTGSFTTTASGDYSLKSGSASVTVAPATIPRYATANQSLASKTSSSITMNWSSDSTVDYIWYSKDNGSNWTAIDVTDGTSGSYTISGLSANTSYNIKTRVRRKDSQLTTDSSPLSVTTYQTTTASISVSSKTETSVTVSSSSNVTVSSTRYRIKTSNGTYGSWQTGNTFSGLSANTYYLIQVEKVGQASGEYGYAETSVTTYQYPHCTSAPDFKIGSNVKLDFYNPLNRTFKIRMWSYASQKFIDDNYISISGTSYTGFGNLKTNLYKSIPDKTESQYNIDVHYGDSKISKAGGKYSINGNEFPTFSNYDYNDVNEKTKQLTDSSKTLINGYSDLEVTITPSNKAYSNYGADIKKYRLNVGNMGSVEETYKSDANVYLKINKINSPSITVTAIDTREYPTGILRVATFKAYFKPVITSLSVVREDGGVGGGATLSIVGSWWNDNFGKTENKIKSIDYYYKKTTDTNWTKGTTIITPTTQAKPNNDFYANVKIDGPVGEEKEFDVTLAYNIKVVVTDELDSSNEYQTVLTAGTPALAIYDNKVSIGLKYDENLGGALQVKGEVIEQGLRVSDNKPNLKEKFWVRKGKNLLKITNNIQETINGVTVSTNSDGSITFNGTCTSGFNIVLSKYMFEELKGNFAFSLKVISGSMTGGNIRVSLNNKGSSSSTNETSRLASFVWVSGKDTASSVQNIYDTMKYLSIYINTSCSFNNCNVIFQLESGSNVTDVEPYVERTLYCKNSNGEYEQFFTDKELDALMNEINYISSIRDSGFGGLIGFSSDLNNTPFLITISNINPTGMPDLWSNACIVITSNPNQSYRAQLAFGFGRDALAIRRCNGSTSWSSWKYVTLS